MRLGGTLFEAYSTPEEWAKLVRREGYSAAYCPVGADADDDEIRAYASVARKARIVIAEVGAWGNNPISPDRRMRKAGIEGCCRQLHLADRIGANCCVNVSGSRGDRWAGPHEGNLTADTFALIVDSVREIIDTVAPRNTFYTLETMPWLYPNSAQSYADLVHAIDRERFAVHFDPVNLVNSPDRYYNSGAMIEEFVQLLGPKIRSCHAKDIILRDELTMHLTESAPGEGNLDWATFVRELGKLGKQMPLMLEHLKKPEQYRMAAAFVRNVAQAEDVAVV